MTIKTALLPAKETDFGFLFLPERAVKMCKGMKTSYTSGEWGKVVKSGDMLRFSNGKTLFAAHLAQVCKAWPSEYAINARIAADGLTLTSHDNKSRVTLKWRTCKDSRFDVYDITHYN